MVILTIIDMIIRAIDGLNNNHKLHIRSILNIKQHRIIQNILNNTAITIKITTITMIIRMKMKMILIMKMMIVVWVIIDKVHHWQMTVSIYVRIYKINNKQYTINHK